MTRNIVSTVVSKLIKNVLYVQSVENKWVAFFLCFFLGFFGAHKFYEGKIIFGIVYLCTCGLLGVGWLIDLILIILKPNPYFV